MANVAQWLLAQLNDNVTANIKSNVANEYHDRLAVALIKEILMNPTGGKSVSAVCSCGV